MGGPDTLSPTLNRAQQAALMRSDTTAQTLLRLPDALTNTSPWVVPPEFTHSHTVTQTD